jgi:hypothetical protein
MSRNGICMEPMKGLNITSKKLHLFSLGMVGEEGHEDELLNYYSCILIMFSASSPSSQCVLQGRSQ